MKRETSKNGIALPTHAEIKHERLLCLDSVHKQNRIMNSQCEQSMVTEASTTAFPTVLYLEEKSISTLTAVLEWCTRLANLTEKIPTTAMELTYWRYWLVILTDEYNIQSWKQIYPFHPNMSI